VQAARDQFERSGIAIAVISFAAPDRLISYQRIHQWSFTVLADPERVAYTHFALERLPWRRVFAPATIKFYAVALLKGRKLENYGRDDYRQSGGDFIVDKRGKVVFAHRSHDPADRPTVQALLGAVREMKA
jgi:peroxiredoxin